jgi:hypothetical protein
MDEIFTIRQIFGGGIYGNRNGTVLVHQLFIGIGKSIGN